MATSANKPKPDATKRRSAKRIENDEAYKKVAVDERNLRLKRYFFYAVTAASAIVIFISILWRTFVNADNILMSWIWVFPIFLALLCLAARRLHFLLVPVVLLIGLLVVVGFLGLYASDLWLRLVGNDTAGYTGLLDGQSVFGMLVGVFLVFVVTPLFVYFLAQRIINSKSSLGSTLLWTLLVIVSFMAPVGWAVTMNAGM